MILDPFDERISSDSDCDTENGDVPRSAEEESTAEVCQPLIIDNEAVHLEPYQPRQGKFAAIPFGKQLSSFQPAWFHKWSWLEWDNGLQRVF